MADFNTTLGQLTASFVKLFVDYANAKHGIQLTIEEVWMNVLRQPVPMMTGSPVSFNKIPGAVAAEQGAPKTTKRKMKTHPQNICQHVKKRGKDSPGNPCIAKASISPSTGQVY